LPFKVQGDDTSDNEVLETNTDDDLEAILKPTRIVTTPLTPLSFLFEEVKVYEPEIKTEILQAAEGSMDEPIIKKNSIESTDDGLIQIEIPIEPIVKKRCRQKKGMVFSVFIK
jgi:hypothetical protein